MTSKPAAVLFDLDGTLFDRDASFLELVNLQHQTFVTALHPVSCSDFARRMIELDEHGYAGKGVAYRTMVSELGLPAELAHRLTLHFQETLASFSRCFPETRSILAALRGHGIKLAIVTNGSMRMQDGKIRQLGIADLVDAILVSEREGVHKPDRLIFERAVTKLGADASNAWHVGDHPIADIKGAFEAGLAPIWRRTPHWGPPEVPCRHIESLEELLQFSA